MRGVTFTDMTVKVCGGTGCEEEERLVQQGYCKDTNRSAGGLVGLSLRGEQENKRVRD